MESDKAQRLLDDMNRIHDNKYQYKLTDDVGRYSANKIVIICPVHGEFNQRVTDHLQGHGCPRCATRSSSRKSISWIEWIAHREGIRIQHAYNGGEHVMHIDGVRRRADGYCASTNTVYEFDGDAYHGNPSRYAPDHRCHPYNKAITASQLYDHTVRKHDAIRAAGYHLVTIWESEFDKLDIPIVEVAGCPTHFDKSYPDRLKETCGLEIIGTYLGSKVVHDMRCDQCGSVHRATPVAKIQSNRKFGTRFCPTCIRTFTCAQK